MGTSFRMSLSTLWSLGSTITLIAIPIALAADVKYHDIPLYVSQGSTDGIDDAIIAMTDFNEPSLEGRLGLVTAAAKKQLEIAHTLLAYHAKTAAIEPLTNTSAMVMAFQKNHTEIAKLLMAYGGDPNLPDGNGVTPRSLAQPNTTLAHYVEIFDKEGTTGFEDLPGCWHINEAKEHNDTTYYYNTIDGRSTYLKPVSCSWIRSPSTDHVSYINSITHKVSWDKPAALAWRRTLGPDGVAFWYNYKTGHSIYWTPIEIPEDLIQEYIEETGDYWQNSITGEVAWEDPRWESWVKVAHNDSGRNYWFHPTIQEAVWDLPVHLAWTEEHSKEHNMKYYFNSMNNDTAWEKPTVLAWIKRNFARPDISPEL